MQEKENRYSHPWRRQRPLLAVIFLLSWSDFTVALLSKFSGARHLTPGSIDSAASGKARPSTSTIITPHYQQSQSDQGERKPLPARYPKAPQVRQKPRSRKPRNYWMDVENLEHELRELWEWANVTIGSKDDDVVDSPPPIPNESLLNYWRRHDLRAAIATHGGREFLAETLGEGAIIIPGKWSLAVQTPYVQELLRQDSNLSLDLPPLSPQQLAKAKDTKVSATNKNTKTAREDNSSSTSSSTSIELSYSNRRIKRWYHKRKDRKPIGYWNSKTDVINELYEYLQERREQERMPEVWMPRMSELTHSGRDDLTLAIRRHGGQKQICKRAGLVPFREWNYIEGMYELLLRLREYLDQYHGGDYRTFPIVSRIKERGNDRLHSLIQYYGGRRFLAARLNMDCTKAGRTRGRSASMSKNQLASADMNWGPFDLEFGIELYSCVREEQMNLRPPLPYPEIRMPSQLTLLRYGGKGLWLDQKIEEYGGYENVARRLGLAFPF